MPAIIYNSNNWAMGYSIIHHIHNISSIIQLVYTVFLLFLQCCSRKISKHFLYQHGVKTPIPFFVTDNSTVDCTVYCVGKEIAKHSRRKLGDNSDC